jgi:hypothetical protein
MWLFADRDDVDGQAQNPLSNPLAYLGSHTSKILNRCDHMTKESESKINIWYHSGIRYILERILGDLRQRLSRRLSRQSATESPSRRRLGGDWSAPPSPTSRHELFLKNIIPTYVRIVRRTSDRILLNFGLIWGAPTHPPMIRDLGSSL